MSDCLQSCSVWTSTETFKSLECDVSSGGPDTGDTLAPAINTELMAELITTIIRSKYQLLTLFVKKINRTKKVGSIGSGSDILISRCIVCDQRISMGEVSYNIFFPC